MLVIGYDFILMAATAAMLIIASMIISGVLSFTRSEACCAIVATVASVLIMLAVYITMLNSHAFVLTGVYLR